MTRHDVPFVIPHFGAASPNPEARSSKWDIFSHI
jgi:hypothetical protein